MSGWILLIIALIAAGFHFLDRFLITVRLHEVEKVGEDEYYCQFFWRGKLREGYFFYEGELPDFVVAKVVGIDFRDVLWRVEIVEY